MATALFHRRRCSEGIAEYRNALQLKPGAFVEARLFIAEALFQSGERQKAAAEIELFLAENPNSPHRERAQQFLELTRAGRSPVNDRWFLLSWCLSEGDLSREFWNCYCPKRRVGDACAAFVRKNAGAVSVVSLVVKEPQPKGRTALYEACYFALEKLRNSSRRKRVLLLVSDGENNISHLKMSRIRRLLQETETVIYAIDVGPLVRSLSQPSAIEWVGPRNLGELALESGGFAFHPKTEAELRAQFVVIASELRWQYLIGFHPTSGSDTEKWHRIEIKLFRRLKIPVSQKDMIVRSRSGYYPIP